MDYCGLEMFTIRKSKEPLEEQRLGNARKEKEKVGKKSVK